MHHFKLSFCHPAACVIQMVRVVRVYLLLCVGYIVIRALRVESQGKEGGVSALCMGWQSHFRLNDEESLELQRGQKRLCS